MSTLLAEPTTRTTTAPVERMRRTMAAVRLSVRWFGVRRSLSTEQKAEAADAFHADGQFLSARKKLVDTAHPAFKAVTGVRSRAVQCWRSCSLPYPEPGVRLIRQDRVEEFAARMREFQEELDEAVASLDRHYDALKSTARTKLGRLYNPADYPDALVGLFGLEYDFPSVEPPEYLQALNPELYQAECRRVEERFNEAVRLAEEAFTTELARLVSHLSERLSGSEDGRPKVFRDSAVENLSQFFARFRELNVRSSADLDNLVAEAQRVIRGVEPQALRDNQGLRQHVVSELARVESVLDGLLVDRPRRNILRRPR